VLAAVAVLLNRRRVPTLVLWGRHDRMLPAEQATVWGRLLPQAEVRVLESCGHGLVVDDAAAVQAVQDFMTRAD